MTAEQFHEVERLNANGVPRARIAKRTGLSLNRVKGILLGELLPPPLPWRCPKCGRRYDFRVTVLTDVCPICAVKPRTGVDADVSADELFPDLHPDGAARRDAMDVARMCDLAVDAVPSI